MRTIILAANTSWFLYNFRLDIFLHLKDEGFRVVAVAPEDEYTQRIKDAGFEYVPIDIDRKGKNAINDVQLIWRLRKIYKTYQPDVIHHFTIKPAIYGTIAARLAGVRRIANSITGLGHVFLNKGLTQSIVRTLYKLAYSSKRVRVIFENPDDQAIFMKYGIIREDQGNLIYGNGVDTKRFDPSRNDMPAASNWDVGASDIVFSLFARMIWDKGIKEFVEAAKVVHSNEPNARFFLFGGVDPGNPAGVDRIWLENVSKLPYVDWIDHVDDVRPYMERSDVVVLPSAYREGVPQSLIEAASMANAIVTTTISGCREIVHDGVNGLLVPPKNIDKLVKAMLKLAADSDLRKHLGPRGGVTHKHILMHKL